MNELERYFRLCCLCFNQGMNATTPERVNLWRDMHAKYRKKYRHAMARQKRA